MKLLGCFAVMKMWLALSMPTSLVGRRVKDQQRLMQAADMRAEQLLLGDIVEKAAAHLERPPGQRHLDLVLVADRVELLAK